MTKKERAGKFRHFVDELRITGQVAMEADGECGQMAIRRSRIYLSELISLLNGQIDSVIPPLSTR